MSDFPDKVPALEIVADHDHCPAPMKETGRYRMIVPDLIVARPLGSLWRCPECHKWWRVGYRYEGIKEGSEWRAVRRFSRAWFKCKWYERSQR